MNENGKGTRKTRRIWESGRRKDKRDEEGSLDHGPWKPGMGIDLSTDISMEKVQSLQQMIKERTGQLYLPEHNRADDHCTDTSHRDWGRRELENKKKILNGPELFI